MKKRVLKTLALFLAALTLCLTAFPAAAAESATAATMQLMKTEGTVDVTNGSGRSLTKRDNMRLYNGYHVKTGAASYAWVDLDSAKLTKLDAVSEVEVRGSGKKLELLLSSGNLFFNVTRPLEEGETLNVRTATMVVGIRGTCGWLKINDRWSTEISVLEGTVQCNVTDPVTGQVKTASVQGGEKAVATVYPQNQTGDKCDISQERLEPGDIGGFVLEELAKDPELCAAIYEASGLDVQDALETAGERLEQDQQEMQETLDRIGDQQSEQDSSVSTGPVWGQEDASAPEAAQPSGSNGKDDRDDRDNAGSGGGTNRPPAEDSGSGGGTDTPAATKTVTVSDTALAEIRTYLEDSNITEIDVVLGDSANDTLLISGELTVNSGVTLTFTNGVYAVVDTGSTFKVPGYLVSNNGLVNNGSLTIEEGGTILTTEITSSGTLKNSGTITGDIMITSGTFTMYKGTVDGNVNLSGSAFILKGGTVDGDISKDNSSTFTNEGGTVTGSIPKDDSSIVTGDGETINDGESGPAAE